MRESSPPRYLRSATQPLISPKKTPRCAQRLPFLLIAATTLAAIGYAFLIILYTARTSQVYYSESLSTSRLRRPLPPTRDDQSDDNLVSLFPSPIHNASFSNAASQSLPKVLILTPVKNSARHLKRFFSNIRTLAYPRYRISIGLLESDSDDPIPADLVSRLEALATEAPGVPALSTMLLGHKAKERVLQRSRPTLVNSSTAAAPFPAANVSNSSHVIPAHPAHVHGKSVAASTRMSGTLALILAEVPSLLMEFGRVSVFQVRVTF